jgi:guanine deaminase
LGSDVAAGPQLNLWQVMRSAIESQKARSFYQKHIPVPSPAEAFYLATQGAALALGKGSQIGSFEPGKGAHLTVINYCALLPFHGSARVDLSSEDVLGLCIDRGGPGAVMESFVRGRSVYRAPKQELF